MYYQCPVSPIYKAGCLMPGIIGYCHTNTDAPALSIETSIDRMSRPDYSLVRHSSSDGRLTLAHTDHHIEAGDVQIFEDSQHGITASLYGNIYEPALPRSEINRFIIDSYLADGPDFADRLQGEFFIVIHDRNSHLLYLINDRFGRRPVYFAHTSSTLMFASSMNAILATGAIDTRVDTSAIADFVSLGLVPGQNTLISGIKLLAPASHLCYTIDSDTFTEHRYWDLRNNLTPLNIDEDDALQQIEESFQNAVARRIKPDITNWLSLSAGMDSRTVASVIGRHQGVKAVTSGVEGCYEKIVTEKIARSIGVDHFFYTFDEASIIRSRSELDSLIHESIDLTDGMRGTSSGAMTAFSARLRHQHSLASIITGHGGEIIKLDEAYNFALCSDDDVRMAESDAANWAYGRLKRPNAPRFNTSELYRGELAEQVTESPQTHIRNITSQIDDQPAAQIASFMFINELFRRKASLALGVQRAYTDIHVPFYDDEFLSLAVRLPLSVRQKYRAHRHIIEKHQPGLLDIVLSETRMPPFPTTVDRLARGVPYRIMKRLGMYKRDVPEEYFASNSNTAYFRDLLLDERTLDRGYYNPDNLAKLIAAQEKGQSKANTLMHLLTINELWHRDNID